MQVFHPTELVGRTFLMDPKEDGSQFRARIIEAIEEVDAAQVEPADTPAANLNHVRGYFDASTLKTGYFLMVQEGTVGVATGLFPCSHQPSAGARAYWLAGDYVRHATTNTVVPPRSTESTVGSSCSTRPSATLQSQPRLSRIFGLPTRTTPP